MLRNSFQSFAVTSAKRLFVTLIFMFCIVSPINAWSRFEVRF